jgi:hypothetical protein
MTGTKYPAAEIPSLKEDALSGSDGRPAAERIQRLMQWLNVQVGFRFW